MMMYIQYDNDELKAKSRELITKVRKFIKNKSPHGFQDPILDPTLI